MSTVIIACKTPSGFTMELNGKEIKINGSNTEDGMIVFERGEQIGITYDVPKDFWDAWRKKFADHPLNTGGFVFETKSEKSAKDQAKDEKGNKTGLEAKTKEELSKVAGATESKDD